MDTRSLHRLYRQLKREHPELLGLGIGWRRKRGRFQKSPAIRLVVAKKCRRNSKSVRHFPKLIRLKSGRRRSLVRISTDVEEAGKWLPTSFPLLINGAPEATATSYASWLTPDGVRHVGVITVAHAFLGPGQPIAVTVANGTVPGVVSLRSDLIADGLDVGLVELQSNAASFLPCLPTTLNPGAASVSTTIKMLGISDTDPLFAEMESWFSNSPADGRALSYYVRRTIQTPNGQSYEMKDVILADGPSGTYSQGRSGSPWIVPSSTPDPLAIALQSHGHVGSSFRLGLGTHFGIALKWLSGQPGVGNLSFGWRIEDLA
jgi:hypothetical protein